MMPVLVILSIMITAYSVTMLGALEDVKYFLIPNFSNFSWMTVVSAMGQMFYSLSIDSNGHTDNIRLIYEKRRFNRKVYHQC